ncbi:MAG TPA: hypothetical protein VK755_14815, partial [Candidatus Acidoferrales bacterium]|nr:hypothetical protein [Candidatus Acidoferrales bacterium]
VAVRVHATSGTTSRKMNSCQAQFASETSRWSSTCAATGAPTGGLAVDTNLGWKGAEKYVATVPQIFDLWQDPQERYDIFMTNFTEHTWLGPVMSQEFEKIGATYLKYPPR